MAAAREFADLPAVRGLERLNGSIHERVVDLHIVQVLGGNSLTHLLFVTWSVFFHMLPGTHKGCARVTWEKEGSGSQKLRTSTHS